MPDTASVFSPDALWESLDLAAAWSGDWFRFRHEEQEKFLHRLVKESPFDLNLKQAGTSIEGRQLVSMRFGRGERRVMIWARQHGDEPDCTAALCLFLYNLITRHEEPLFKLLLDKISFCIFPMVNPDGVYRFTRQNAQGIDLNRDAVAQTTPESKALIALKDDFQPEYAFNLHDMSARKSTGNKDLVALAFQAGPFEPGDTDNEVRLKGKHIIGLMAEAARTRAPRNLARYTADYMHTAFGDSMMRWGVSTILVESGGWFPEKGGDEFVIRLFAMSLIRGLHAIANGEDAKPSGKEYDRLPFDSGKAFADEIYEGARVFEGGALNMFDGDIAVNLERRTRRVEDSKLSIGAFEGVGDLQDRLAKSRRQINGKVVLPGIVGLAPALNFGTEIPKPEAVMPYLRAGVTTLAAAFGPFADDRDCDAFAATLANTPPPIHMLPLERVQSLEEIIRRHGMTDLSGMVVSGLTITPQQLIDFTHVYHPAHHSAVPEDEADRLIGLNIIFQGAASNRQTRFHLNFHSLNEEEAKKTRPVDPLMLKRIADEFLRHPNQLFFSTDILEPDWHGQPLVLSRAGSRRDYAPPPNFLAHAIDRAHAEDEGAISTLISLLTYQSAKSWRMKSVGLIRVGYRADFVVLPESILDPTTIEGIQPEIVVLNGQVVIDRERNLERPGVGLWNLASD
ncbi:amidohydrolase family protein [bacterium]|nr:amidohydrolase family protein [bacterium]